MTDSIYELCRIMGVPIPANVNMIPISDITFTRVKSTKPKPKKVLPEIKDVIFNNPATIVLWEDGTKTIVKCQKGTGDVYSKETGLAMAIVKKAYGNNGAYNDIMNKWLSKKNEI